MEFFEEKTTQARETTSNIFEAAVIHFGVNAVCFHC
jgi:hypothetical protein